MTLILLLPVSMVIEHVLRVSAARLGVLELETQQGPGVAGGLRDVEKRVSPSGFRGGREGLEVGVDRGDDPWWELMGPESVECPHQAIDGRAYWRNGAVARFPGGNQLEPERHLLGHLDAELLAPVGLGAVAPFVQKEPGARECLRVVLHHPSGAEGAAGLFVRRRHEHDVAGKRRLLPVQGEERLQLHDAQRLGVERTPAVDHPVLFHRGEGIDRPVAGIGRDHVHVVEEDQGGLAFRP